MPSPEAPLAGSCACGTVQFQRHGGVHLRRLLPLHALPAPRGHAVEHERDGCPPTAVERARRSGFAAHLAPARRAPEVVLRRSAAVTSSAANLACRKRSSGSASVRCTATRASSRAGGSGSRRRPTGYPIPDDGLPRFAEQARDRLTFRLTRSAIVSCGAPATGVVRRRAAPRALRGRPAVAPERAPRGHGRVVGRGRAGRRSRDASARHPRVAAARPDRRRGRLRDLRRRARRLRLADGHVQRAGRRARCWCSRAC